MDIEKALDILKRARIALATANVDGDRLLEPMSMAIDALEKTSAETVRTWIPISERLPDRSDRVLTYSPAMAGSDADIQINKGFMCHNKRTDITHWMPLPEAPKEGDEPHAT